MVDEWNEGEITIYRTLLNQQSEITLFTTYQGTVIAPEHYRGICIHNAEIAGKKRWRKFKLVKKM